MGVRLASIYHSLTGRLLACAVNWLGILKELTSEFMHLFLVCWFFFKKKDNNAMAAAFVFLSQNKINIF